MTKVYRPVVREGQEWALPVDDADFETLRALATAGHAADWRPVRMELVREDEGRMLLPSDCPWCMSNLPVLKPAAVDALFGLLRNDAELLPLDCAHADLHALNVTTAIDALDVEASQIVWFSGQSKIMTIKRYAFRPEPLDGALAFRIPQFLRGGPVLFTQPVVDRSLDAGLQRVDFELVWATGDD